MFKKNCTVACSGFSFLAFKAYSDLECRGPVVTKAVSQKILGGGPLWGRLWRVLQTVAENRDCSPPWSTTLQAQSCHVLPLANLWVCNAICLFIFLFCNNSNFYESCMNNTKNSCIPLPRLPATFISPLLSPHMFTCTCTCTHTHLWIYMWCFSEPYVSGLLAQTLFTPCIS